MKIEIVPSISNLPQQEGYIRFTEKDFNHYESFFAKHPDIQPESADVVYTKGILEISDNPTIILRHIDWLLKKDGMFIVDGYQICGTARTLFFYTISGVQYFISLAFGSRIILEKRQREHPFYHLEYRKTESSLAENDNIGSWSFGICSNGSHNDWIMTMIGQLVAMNIPNLEILVCGPAPSDKLPDCVRVIDDAPIYMPNDLRIPISKKENLLAQEAKYENIVIMHDRYEFPPDWYEKMKQFGNYFDLMKFRCYVINGDMVVTDWDYFDILNRRFSRDGFEYKGYNEFVYMDGGFLIMKKRIWRHYQINNALQWDEYEDVDYSHMLLQLGYIIQTDKNNRMLSHNHRLYGYYPQKETWKSTIQQKKVDTWGKIVLMNDFYQYLGLKKYTPTLKEWIRGIFYRMCWFFAKKIS